MAAVEAAVADRAVPSAAAVLLVAVFFAEATATVGEEDSLAAACLVAAGTELPAVVDSLVAVAVVSPVVVVSPAEVAC